MPTLPGLFSNCRKLDVNDEEGPGDVKSECLHKAPVEGGRRRSDGEGSLSRRISSLVRKLVRKEEFVDLEWLEQQAMAPKEKEKKQKRQNTWFRRSRGRSRRRRASTPPENKYCERTLAESAFDESQLRAKEEDKIDRRQQSILSDTSDEIAEKMQMLDQILSDEESDDKEINLEQETTSDENSTCCGEATPQLDTQSTGQPTTGDVGSSQQTPTDDTQNTPAVGSDHGDQDREYVSVACRLHELMTKGYTEAASVVVGDAISKAIQEYLAQQRASSSEHPLTLDTNGADYRNMEPGETDSGLPEAEATQEIVTVITDSTDAEAEQERLLDRRVEMIVNVNLRQVIKELEDEATQPEQVPGEHRPTTHGDGALPDGGGDVLDGAVEDLVSDILTKVRSDLDHGRPDVNIKLEETRDLDWTEEGQSESVKQSHFEPTDTSQPKNENFPTVDHPKALAGGETLDVGSWVGEPDTKQSPTPTEQKQNLTEISPSPIPCGP